MRGFRFNQRPTKQLLHQIPPSEMHKHTTSLTTISSSNNQQQQVKQRWRGAKLLIPLLTLCYVLSQMPTNSKTTKRVLLWTKENQEDNSNNGPFSAATTLSLNDQFLTRRGLNEQQEPKDENEKVEVKKAEQEETTTEVTDTTDETSLKETSEAVEATSIASDTPLLQSNNQTTSYKATATPGVVPLVVLTAVTENHALESEVMLKTLVKQNYTGPLYYFLMCRKANPKGDNTGQDSPAQKCLNWRRQIQRDLPQKMPLDFTFIDFEIIDPVRTYCFKPKAIAKYFELYYNKQPHHPRPQALLWADASARLHNNPNDGAIAMVQDKVDFVGEGHSWFLPMQTHKGTFDYYQADPMVFSKIRAMIATYFMINLEKYDDNTVGNSTTDNNNNPTSPPPPPPPIHYSATERFQKYHSRFQNNSTLPTTFHSPFESILKPWMDCAVLACRMCMAPPGSSKGPPLEDQILTGPVQYRGHRQDQAILALLVRHYERNRYRSKTRRQQMIRTQNETRHMYLHIHHYRGVEDEEGNKTAAKK